jgi:hypothetical protein
MLEDGGVDGVGPGSLGETPINRDRVNSPLNGVGSAALGETRADGKKHDDG